MLQEKASLKDGRLSVANEHSFYVKRKKAGKGGWYFHSIRRADKAKQCIDTDPYIHTYTLSYRSLRWA